MTDHNIPIDIPLSIFPIINNANIGKNWKREPNIIIKLQIISKFLSPITKSGPVHKEATDEEIPPANNTGVFIICMFLGL